jgi:hypothetical protein
VNIASNNSIKIRGYGYEKILFSLFDFIIFWSKF